MNWLRKLLSQDPSASSSRALQAFIAVNMIAILWVVLAKAHWVVSDNVRLISICLIGAGASGYAFNKLKELQGAGDAS